MNNRPVINLIYIFHHRLASERVRKPPLALAILRCEVSLNNADLSTLDLLAI